MLHLILEPCGDSILGLVVLMGFALMRDALLFASPANILLSFLLPPIQLFFLLLTTRVVLLFDPYCPWCFYSCCSCRYCCCSSCIMSWHTRRLLVSRRLWYKLYAVPLLRPLLLSEFRILLLVASIDIDAAVSSTAISSSCIYSRLCCSWLSWLVF